MAGIVAVLLVSAFVAGSALSTDHEHSSVIRRDAGAVQMNAGGAMKVVAEPAQKTQPMQEMIKRLHDAVKARRARVVSCDDDFTHGVAGTNDCTADAAQMGVAIHIESEAVCKEAAKLACPGNGTYSCIGEPFLLTDATWANHPKRCFIDAADNKWYHNGVGYDPTTIETGDIPICIEPEYAEGQQDSNDCHHNAYEEITDELMCRKAAECLASCIHEEFRVPEAQRATSPKGCHKSTLGCIRFNVPNETHPGGTAPAGKPICKHTDDDTDDATDDATTTS